MPMYHRTSHVRVGRASYLFWRSVEQRLSLRPWQKQGSPLACLKKQGSKVWLWIPDVGEVAAHL